MAFSRTPNSFAPIAFYNLFAAVTSSVSLVNHQDATVMRRSSEQELNLNTASGFKNNEMNADDPLVEDFLGWKKRRKDDEATDDEIHRKKMKAAASGLTPAQLARKEELNKNFEAEVSIIKADRAEIARLSQAVEARQKLIDGLRWKMKNIQDF